MRAKVLLLVEHRLGVELTVLATIRLTGNNIRSRIAMISLKIVASGLALLGSSMPVSQASGAMPVNGLAPAEARIGDNVQHVWCGPYRCWGPGWRRWAIGVGLSAWGYRPGAWGYRPWGWGRLWAYGTGWWSC